MKPLKLGKNDFGLRVFCTICKRNFNESTIRNCSHSENQKYKVIIYVDSDKTRSRTYDTREYSEALKEAIAFKETIKVNPTEEVNMVGGNHGLIISYLADKYIDFKKGVDVPEIRHRNVTTKHIDAITRDIRNFLLFLKSRGIDPNSHEITRINDKTVDEWYSKIKTDYGIGSLRTIVCHVRNWVNWILEEYEVNMKNPFRGTNIPSSNKPIEAISRKEFWAVIKEVRKGNVKANFAKSGKVRMKNIYRDYLEDAFMLGILTGLRREELIQLRWSNLCKVRQNEAWVILSTNFKVENQLKKTYKPKIVPVTEELRLLLDKMGWAQNIMTDKYILHPERTYSEASMRNDITKSFMHYYRIAFPGGPSKSFKSLRRTYITMMNNLVGPDLINLTSHSGIKVIENHYLDPILVSKAIDLRILSE